MGGPLPDVFICLAVYWLLQLIKPPLKVWLTHLLPSDKEWQDNGVRACGYILTYVLVVANTAAAHPIDWAGTLLLLKVAGAIYGGSALLFHIQE